MKLSPEFSPVKPRWSWVNVSDFERRPLEAALGSIRAGPGRHNGHGGPVKAQCEAAIRLCSELHFFPVDFQKQKHEYCLVHGCHDPAARRLNAFSARGAVATTIAAALVEFFPTRIRYTSMSLPYHIGNGWFGGLLPATSFALVAQTGDIYYGLWYPIVFALATFVIGLLFVPETKDRDIYAND